MEDVYFGPYVIVPNKGEQDLTVYSCTNEKCPKYGKHMPGKFCSECGANLGTVVYKRVSVSFDLYGFCKEHFGNGDFFTRSVREDCILIIANCKGQIGQLLKDGFDQIPLDRASPALLTGDWAQLVAALFAAGIEHECRYGIVEVVWN